MGVRWRFAALFGLVAAFAAPAQAADVAADKAWSRDAKAAREALSRSAGAGFVTGAEHARYLGLLSHARVVRDRVPPARARILESLLDTLARAKSPTAPRALVLYSTLEQNVDYLAEHQLPAGGTDIIDADGVVYRFFAGAGFAFHPLANGTRLNELIAEGQADEARALVDALAARLTPKTGGGAVWEYQFDFGNVRAPWTSGMAQAVLAQALARAGALDLARRAWQAIPGALDRELAAGPWIKLYSSSSLTVLNAQLQSAVSLRNYAAKSGDTSAADYAARLLDTAKAMLHRFDTGHWSRYSLGTESTLEYHDYVIDLLTTLGKTTGDQAWTDAAERFALYETQPPELTAPTLTRVVYPWPEDGVGDELVVRFWLSKPSQVALVVDGEAVDGYRWRAGWHTFRWMPAGLGPGEYRVRLAARSLDGQSGSSTLPNVRFERDRAKPALAASKADGRVFWRAKDGESACCKLRLELRRGGERRVLPVERTKGSARIPSGYWLVTVAARDAAGNLTRTEVGLVVGREIPA
jgi:hypothetical protein